MKLQKGQINIVKQHFPNVAVSDCSVIAEGGSDNGVTFHGRFLVNIKRKGHFSFEDGKLKKKLN